MCERMLDGLQDFAMEFRVSGGDVRFAGYSVFFNNAQMSYDNAMVASTGLLREYLDEKSGGYDFDTLQSQLREALCEIVPDDYEGYIGVDMLLYRREDGTVGVNPCIEMNVRTTMGVVASVLGVSRWKNLAQVNAAAARASADTGVPYVEIEGRKHGMQEARLALIKELGLYNQDYCGCVYSEAAALARHKNSAA